MLKIQNPTGATGATSVEQRDGKLWESHEYPISSHNIMGWDVMGLRFFAA